MFISNRFLTLQQKKNVLKLEKLFSSGWVHTSDHLHPKLRLNIVEVNILIISESIGPKFGTLIERLCSYFSRKPHNFRVLDISKIGGIILD